MLHYSTVSKHRFQGMKKPAIVFDLDDTLLETFKRQYTVIKKFIENENISFSVSFEEYLSKRQSEKISNFQFYKTIVSPSTLDEKYKTFFLEEIETSNYLSLDTLIIDTNLLETLCEKSSLFIISLRSNADNAQTQIENLGLAKYISKAFFVKHSQLENPKLEILKQLQQEYIIEYFIGDSKTDYEAAQEATIPFIYVNTGLEKTPTSTSYENINLFLKHHFQNANI